MEFEPTTIQEVAGATTRHASGPVGPLVAPTYVTNAGVTNAISWSAGPTKPGKDRTLEPLRVGGTTAGRFGGQTEWSWPNLGSLPGALRGPRPLLTDRGCDPPPITVKI